MSEESIVACSYEPAAVRLMSCWFQIVLYLNLNGSVVRSRLTHWKTDGQCDVGYSRRLAREISTIVLLAYKSLFRRIDSINKTEINKYQWQK